MGKDKPIGNGVSAVCQILQKPADMDKGLTAGVIFEGAFGHAAKPTENMYSFKLDGCLDVGMVLVQIAQQTIYVYTIVLDGAWSQGGAHGLQLLLKQEIEP